jgi:hypothetical protein
MNNTHRVRVKVLDPDDRKLDVRDANDRKLDDLSLGESDVTGVPVAKIYITHPKNNIKKIQVIIVLSDMDDVISVCSSSKCLGVPDSGIIRFNLTLTLLF